MQIPQFQTQRPGHESKMLGKPEFDDPNYKGSSKLAERVAVITGGDSGIGRSVAVLFAKEGADVAIIYKDEHEDAEETKQHVEGYGRRCLLFPGDIGDESFCQLAVQQTFEKFGRIDILVNNAAEQHPQDSIADITAEQLERVFKTNIIAMFFMVKAVLPHLKKGAAIINTTSVLAYKGSGMLLDYATTKGAIVAFTRSLSAQLVGKEIRVNAVAPGPIWTPFIPSTFPAHLVALFGAETPMKRAGQPHEVGKCFVFLAADDSSYLTGQVLHPNGGDVVNA